MYLTRAFHQKLSEFPKFQMCLARIIAGSFVLISLALGYLHSPWWHLFTAFVGLNLIQSAITGFCLAEIVLKKFGIGQCSCCTKQ